MGFWVGVEDVAALFEQYRLNGVKVRNPPTNYAWTGEMQAEDLDGNILRLGSEPKSDQTVGVARHAREPLGAVAGGRVDSSF
jgi:hypothetical protein